jgi:hypothetical protein
MVMANVSPGATVLWDTLIEVISGPSLSTTTPRDAMNSSPRESIPIATMVWLPAGTEPGICSTFEIAPDEFDDVSPKSMGVEYITKRTLESG